jgi:hypothetical protein
MYAVFVVPSLRFARMICLLRGWLVAVSAALVAAVIGVSLSSWVYVDAVGNGTSYYQDVGIWRTCRLVHASRNHSNTSSPLSRRSHLECTSLDLSTVSGKHQCMARYRRRNKLKYRLTLTLRLGFLRGCRFSRLNNVLAGAHYGTDKIL